MFALKFSGAFDWGKSLSWQAMQSPLARLTWAGWSKVTLPILDWKTSFSGTFSDGFWASSAPTPAATAKRSIKEISVRIGASISLRRLKRVAFQLLLGTVAPEY